MIAPPNTRLDDIGFYTLSDYRAAQASATSPMWRCEMILTGKCNFNCPYCRGLSALSRECGDMDPDVANAILDIWIKDDLKHIRFSGGEPTLYRHIGELVTKCHIAGVERIAISTNGSQSYWFYRELVSAGVNDFSISLDACCSAFGDKMAGVSGHWETVVDNIRRLSKLTYVTVGIVLTEDTVANAKDIITLAHDLGVSDIRIVSSAQYNIIPEGLSGISEEILKAHPILRYRVQHFTEGRNVRGIQVGDAHKCHLVLDDSIVAGKWHFPCVIHMREGGEPIGPVSPTMRLARKQWSETHDTFADPICRENCLDVCIDYNNQCARIRAAKHFTRTVHV